MYMTFLFLNKFALQEAGRPMKGHLNRSGKVQSYMQHSLFHLHKK